MRRRRIAALALALVLAGCAGAPVGVKRLDPRMVDLHLTGSVLSTGEPSHATRNELQRRNLVERFDDDPGGALATLHEAALASGDADSLFALAELSFLDGDRRGDRGSLLAASVYAWAFLFGGAALAPFDPREEVAAELYNRGLTDGLESADGTFVDLRSGTFALPFGALEIRFDESVLDWNGRRLREFAPVAELEVEGLRSRFRTAGIGAALAASAEAEDPDRSTDFLAPRLKIPVTALLRIEDPLAQIRSGVVEGTLELYTDPTERPVEIDGREVPLESEQTATIAAMLADSPFWKQELGLFLGSVTTQTAQGRLVGLRPHKSGRTPVVFVHGTNSSPGRWAEMVNVLDNDPRIHARFEPWFFFYNSGAPIGYSIHLLRQALVDTVGRFEAESDDACLGEMVVIGHSQGGLLTKGTVIDTGDRFWKSLSRKPLEEVRGLTDAQRKLVRDLVFFEPLPFVKRVVFIATPHHGSFLAAGSFVRGLIGRLVRLPRALTDVAQRAVAGDPDAFVASDLASMTAVDNMSPRHRFIRNMAASPIAPGVAAHSIIAVEGTGPVEDGDDGVVAYRSAHVEGVESEKVVRSSHSVQGHPEAIEEVRRILLLHAAESACRG